MLLVKALNIIIVYFLLVVYLGGDIIIYLMIYRVVAVVAWSINELTHSSITALITWRLLSYVFRIIIPLKFFLVHFTTLLVVLFSYMYCDNYFGIYCITVVWLFCFLSSYGQWTVNMISINLCSSSLVNHLDFSMSSASTSTFDVYTLLWYHL